jgi:putative ABC transport system ATP-binding protein
MMEGTIIASHSAAQGSADKQAILIDIRGASKSYPVRGGQTFHALRGVSLEIKAGDYVAVLGKSGSGKSTLLNLIAGLDRANAGSLQVAGRNLSGMNENAMALWRGKHIGVVFQFFQLLPTLTVLENIILAMELVGTTPASARRDRAMAQLGLVDLVEHAMKLPSMLSGGQQQRAAIARALANDPPILLADEPTGNLDTETAADVNGLFQRLAAQGKTLLIVTHDASLAATAHRVIELRDGVVIADNARPAAS